MKRILALSVLAIAVGCSSPPKSSLSLGSSPVPLELRSTGRTIHVLEPIDVRPLAEIEGEGPRFDGMVWVPWPVPPAIFGMHTLRGSVVTGRDSFADDAWSQLHQSLGRCVRSSGLFAAETGVAPDYVLETEVVHLCGCSYQVHVWSYMLVYVGITAAGGVEKNVTAFSPHGTAALRLRLRDREGRVIAERVIANAVLGESVWAEPPAGHLTSPSGPRNDNLLPESMTSGGFRMSHIALAARDALQGCLLKARAQVASWVLEHESGQRRLSDVERTIEVDHGAGHTFWIHAVDADRTGVVFSEVACPSGKVLSSRRVEGVPIVGRPGYAMLSPIDEHGIRMPTIDYDALSRHLSRWFVLHRVDEVAAYNYFGRR